MFQYYNGYEMINRGQNPNQDYEKGLKIAQFLAKIIFVFSALKSIFEYNMIIHLGDMQHR